MVTLVRCCEAGQALPEAHTTDERRERQARVPLQVHKPVVGEIFHLPMLPR